MSDSKGQRETTRQQTGEGTSETRTLSRTDFLRIAGGFGALGIGAVIGLNPQKASAQKKNAKDTMDTPVISCGTATQLSINVQVTAGASGAPAGFSLHWMTLEAFTALGSIWPSSDDPALCHASFSGNANISRYNLGANESVTVNIGELLFDNGASSNCISALTCGTDYVFRAFAHASNTLKRSEFTGTKVCNTLACASEGVCTQGFGHWKTRGVPGCNPSGNTNLWPVTSLTLGSLVYTDIQLCSILNAPAAGNGLIILAHQLIAAKFNIANGSDPTAVAATVAAADALIGSLVIPPVGSGTLTPSSVETIKNALQAYNEGAVGPGTCPA